VRFRDHRLQFAVGREDPVDSGECHSAAQ
jgi:hypothetical protein